jgi:two-component system chemotaxis sensor kinase CheA
MDVSQYLEIFIEETKEHLQGLNQSLLQLEKIPDDMATLNEIFRVAHTLKGMSGTMGFNKMSTLTHDMEDVLQALRNGEVKVNTGLVDLLFKCLDALEDYLNNIISSVSEGTNDYADIIKALNNIVKDNKSDSDSKTAVHPADKNTGTGSTSLPQAVLQINQYEQNVINKAYDMGINAYQITVVLSKGCLLKSARAFIIFQTFEKFSEIIKSVPSVEDIEDEKFDFEFTVVVVSKESAQTLSNALNSISEVDKVLISILSPDGESGEASSEVAASSTLKAVQDTTSDERENEDRNSHVKDSPVARKSKTGKTVRVDIDRLDVLLNLVSELIIQKTRLEELEGIEKNKTYTETVEYLERITTNLHDAVMKVRMVPVETVFNRFPRMIRDVSRELGKEIELIMSGEETELDRTVIDEIGDPLIHLLRNSADHGLESAEERKRLGKSAEGHIYLKAYQEGNNVVIEVADDGRGINLDKVKRKAIENGLVSTEIANSLSQNDIVEFLFRPSFSTADKITDISGRGVGLDVVKNKIEILGGTVEVETETGIGSRFIIRLPLTLAIIQALLVMVGNEKYAIPLNSIKQITKIVQSDIKLVQNQEVMLLRNMVIPIVRLDKVLEVPKKEKAGKYLTVVIVSKGEKLSGFLVDNLIGQQEIVIKSLGKYLSGIKSIAGATILGDGNVALILDVNSLA